MTCIVAYVSDGKIWMGGDRRSTINGSIICNLAYPKIWQTSIQGTPVLMGCCGSAALHPAVQHILDLPKEEGGDIVVYLSKHLIPALKTTLKAQGLLATKEGKLEMEGTLLMGIRGRIFSIDSIFALTESEYPFLITGSGLGAAMGSMLTSLHYGKTDPEDCIRLAIETASKVYNNVGGEIDILSI